MVDPVDGGFVEDFVQAVARSAGAGRGAPEGLPPPRAPPAASLPQSRRADTVRDGRVLAGLRRETEQRVAAGVALAFDLAEFLAQALIEPLVADIAGHIVEPARELRPHLVV